jgi:hypothetical protein
MDHRTIAIAAVLMAAALTGIFTTSLLAYADESETSTDQEIEQKNVGSGDSNNNNCAENEIDSWATAAGRHRLSFQQHPPTVCPATLFSCTLEAQLPPPPLASYR